MQSQANLNIKKGIDPCFAQVVVIATIYFVSTLIGHPVFSAILAFPAVYIAPGFLLISLLSRGQSQKFRQLIVSSFFLSTIIAVIVISMLMLFGVTICTFSIGMYYLLLTLTLVVLLTFLRKTIQIHISRLDYVFLTISFIAYVTLILSFIHMRRLFTIDETAYITWSRYAILKGEAYPFSLESTKLDLVYLIRGRFFWTLLIASFIGATGIAAYHSYIMNSMFLPMIALASTLLIPSKFKENKILEIAVFIIILTNPLLLLFSGFILNDLALSFYLLLAILFFIRSFSQSPQGGVPLNLRSLLVSFLILIIAFLIKGNIVIAIPMYLILIFHIFRYKLHKSDKTWRGVLYILILPLIAYEVLVDMPYVISLWFVKNPTIAWLTGRFLFMSPAEWILGLFMSTPWKPTTVFSYNLYDYLHFLYRMLSPEILNPLVSGVAMALPFMLTLEGFHRDTQARLLICIATITLWLTYILYLSFNAFWDIPRYFLFMVPILVTVSLVALYETLSSRKTIVGGVLILSMIVLLSIQSLLAFKKGGVYISYGLPKLNWTGNVLILQVIIYAALIFLITVGTGNKIPLTFSLRRKFEVKTVINIKMLTFIVLILTALVTNAYFSVYSILNSTFYKNSEAEKVNSLFNEIKSNDTFIFSNFYAHMRSYVPDYLIKNDYLFPPPMTEDEFKKFLQVAPNNTLLIVSHDPSITWYEYGNRYIKKYTKTDLIPLEPKHERVIYKGLLLDLRLGDLIDGSVYDRSENNYTCIVNGGKLVNGFFGNAVQFNGEEEYALVNDFEFPDEYSVEIWFMLEKNPSDFGFMEDGSPISKILLAKRYHGYVELMLFITNEGEIVALAKNENNSVRYSLRTPKGLVKANQWYQTILTVDEQSAKLYLNGVLVGESAVRGLNQRLKDYPESSKEPLKIGADGTSIFTKYRYFPGRIEDVRVYNRSLTVEEIEKMYYGVGLLKMVNGIKIFKIRTPIQLRVQDDSKLVNITSVKIYFTNATHVRLTIKANAIDKRKIFIIIGTIRFLKMLTAYLKPGQNEISWDFKARLEDRSAYGLYIASMAKIIIYDENGDLLYNKMHSCFVLSGVYLFLWILILTMLIFSTLFLIGRL